MLVEDVDDDNEDEIASDLTGCEEDSDSHDSD